MRILLIGGAGQLGRDILSVLAKHEVTAPSRDRLDIINEANILQCFRDTAPELVIHTGAYHNVALCEQNPELAYQTNVLGTIHLAKACDISKSKLIIVSTDYVFDGRKGSPYIESDPPSPLMTYGISKLAGEYEAMRANPNTLIIRTAGLFGAHPCRAKPGGLNFVETMRKLAHTKKEIRVVADIISCPTFTADLASQIKHLAANEAPPGVYHAVNGHGISWYDFAKLIFMETGLSAKVIPVTDDAFPVPFKRPSDTRLKNQKLNTLGLNIMPPLENALRRYLEGA